MEDVLTIIIGIIFRFVTQELKNWFKVESEALKLIIVLILSAGAGWGLYYAYPGTGTEVDAVRYAIQAALAAIATQATIKNATKKTT